MARDGFYAVVHGRRTGVFRSWAEAAAQVEGFPGNEHRKFSTLAQAEAFLRGDDNQGVDSDVGDSDGDEYERPVKRARLEQSLVDRDDRHNGSEDEEGGDERSSVFGAAEDDESEEEAENETGSDADEVERDGGEGTIEVYEEESEDENDSGAGLEADEDGVDESVAADDVDEATTMKTKTTKATKKTTGSKPCG